MNIVLSQILGNSGWGIGQIVLCAIAVIGFLVILYIFASARGITIPDEFKKYGWTVLAVIVACLCVYMIMRATGMG